MKQRHYPRTCPACGERRIARIFWGMPGLTPELQADLDAGRAVLGGCVVRPGHPERRCLGCGAEFGGKGRLARRRGDLRRREEPR